MTRYYDLVMAETLSRYAEDSLKESGFFPKGIAPPGASEDERWAIAKKELYQQPIVAITEWGLIDFNPETQKTLSHGENITYDDYLDLMRKSGHSVRQDFEKVYYDASWCSFKGRVERINQKQGTICFERIFIDAEYSDGDGFFGKEDHVWMDLSAFLPCKQGDCFSFIADVYRYVKTGNGKMIDFGLRDPQGIHRIDEYELPSDDQLRLQTIDEIICNGLCMYNKHCNGVVCIANEEWREAMRAVFLEKLPERRG